MLTPRQPEGCVPVVVSSAHDATNQRKTSDTSVTGRLFSVSHESDAERAAVWLDRTIAVNISFKNASPSSSRGNETHFS